jgi:hypothetical protein
MNGDLRVAYRTTADLTGSDAPVPGWSKKIIRPSDVIASTHP